MPDSSPADPKKPSLLVVSSTYLSNENRKKMHALAEFFRVHCVVPDRLITPIGTEIKGERVPADLSIDLHFLPTFGNTQKVTQFSFRGLKQLMRGQSFDLILVESEPWALMRWHTWWLKRRFQPGALFGEYSWENFRRPGWKGFVLSFIYGAAIQTSRFIITGNRDGHDLYRQSGAQEARILTAPQMGIDATHFRPATPERRRELREMAGIAAGTFAVGFCGRYDQCKGVLDLLTVIGNLRAFHPELELHLMGGGELKAELEVRSQKLPWLKLHGPVPHSQVPDFLNLLDLFVHPSKPKLNAAGQVVFKEQFPYALGQAMFCGIPSVATRSGAIPDMMNSGEMLCAEHDLHGLQQLVQRAIEDSAFRETGGVRQREHMLQHFTQAKQAEIWSQFLLQVLSNRSPRRN